MAGSNRAKEQTMVPEVNLVGAYAYPKFTQAG